MTDTLFLLVASYGAAILFAVTFLSCLAVPVPSSLMMLTGGAFAASGDLLLTTTALSAYAGAIGGDQVGYLVGQRSTRTLDRWAADRPRRAVLLGKARSLIREWGGIGVFLSRWLVSPLGPYVNLAGGAAGIGWARFTVWGAAGEAVWVGLYTGLGYAFASNISAVAEIAGDASGLIAGGVVTLGLGLWLRAAMKRQERRRPNGPSGGESPGPSPTSGTRRQRM